MRLAINCQHEPQQQHLTLTISLEYQNTIKYINSEQVNSVEVLIKGQYSIKQFAYNCLIHFLTEVIIR